MITGGSGMVGSQIDFGKKPPRSVLNILDEKSIQNAVKKYRPSAILHLAALVDMQICENSPELAYETNVLGTYNIAKICGEKNIRLVFLSTGAVFNGRKKTPYMETDSASPLNVYGRTKYIGEIIIKDLVKNHLILRTGWLFGGGKKGDKKFALKFFKMMQKGETIFAIQNRYGSPTYVLDLVQGITKLMRSRLTGTIHLVNSGTASYFDIARFMLKSGKFSAKIRAIKILNHASTKLKRGKMEGMKSKKISLRPWQEAMREYINYLIKHIKH